MSDNSSTGDEIVQREYPYENGDFIVLGPEIFTNREGTVISWKGQNYVLQVENLQPKNLKAYSIGELVEVDRNGDWLPGRVSSSQAGILNVDTSRGPVGVGSYHRIRKSAR